MANSTRATPTCIGKAFVKPTRVALLQASKIAIHPPIAAPERSKMAAAGSRITKPAMRSPSTQAITENKIAESTSTPMIATSSDNVETASNPRKDMTQIEVAANMPPR